MRGMDLIRNLATRERHVFAASKHVTLTLGELRNFIARLDAEGAAESTPLRGKVSFRGRRLLGITASIIRFGDPERRAGGSWDLPEPGDCEAVAAEMGIDPAAPMTAGQYDEFARRMGEHLGRRRLARREASLRASGVPEGTIRMMRP